MEAAKEVKLKGRANDLVDRIASDEYFELSKKEIMNILNPANLCGIAPLQTEDYIKENINPILEKYAKDIENINIQVKV